MYTYPMAFVSERILHANSSNVALQCEDYTALLATPMVRSKRQLRSDAQPSELRAL